MLFIEDQEIIGMLAFLGSLFLIMIAMLLFIVIKEKIEDYIKIKKYEYKRNHRFDKAPTAKCYCIDCVYRNIDNGKCDIKNINHCYDAWFCFDATPKKYGD